MKNIKLFITVITLTSFTTIFAQDIKGGIKGGINYSFFTEDTNDNQGNVGFDIGYYEVLDFGNKVKLQAEVNYVNNGYKNSKAKISHQYNYFEIPVFIKYTIAENFDLGAGVKYAFGRKGTMKIEGQNGQDDITEDTDNADAGFGFVIDGQYTMDKLNFGLRININSGEVINGYDRRNASLYVGYDLF